MANLYNSKSQSTKLLKLKWDVGMLNKIIGYSLKRSNNITNLDLRNVQKLFNSCDFHDYYNRPVILERVKFILNALEAKLDNRFEDESLILSYCTPDSENIVVEDVLKNLDRYKSLNYKEITFISDFVQDRLKYGIFINKIERVNEIKEKVEAGDYRTYAEVNDLMTEWIHDYMSEKRKVSSSWNNNVMDFNDPAIGERVNEIKKRLGDNSSILLSGISMLNDILSPGFRPGKLYVFLGLTGGFKSAMLLKIILDCVKFNAGAYVPKKEGAKPYVLYLTMENTIDESFARVWNMAIEDSDVENVNTDDIIKRLKKEKIVANDKMGIIFMYYSNMSISTADLRDILDELEADGKDIALLSFDYIKRIRPQQKAKDEKEMLKNVTNELRTIAIDYHMPIITAQQFNRAALAVVNNAKRNGEADLSKYLGGDNVGSAYEVMENADMTISLCIEQRKDDLALFLTFNLLKARYRVRTKQTYFNQPFHPDNAFQLLNDVTRRTPLGVISLDSSNISTVGADGVLAGKKGRMNYKSPFSMEMSEKDTPFDLDSL